MGVGWKRRFGRSWNVTEELMNANELSLRKLATILGVSQPFLSQIGAGKRPLPQALKRKVEALGAYR